MAKLSLVKGTTSYSAYIFVQNSSVTTGAGLTGLVYNSGSLVASYVRPGASRVAITLATQTVTGAFSSGGFVEVDATNMPGVYRLDVPDAALASGVNAVVVMLKGATNMVPVVLEIELTAINNQDSVRAGLTALPNAAAGANGGLPTGNASGQVAVSSHATGAIAAASFAAGAIDNAAIATDAIGSAELAATAAAEIATQVRTELTTELGRIDAAISSRSTYAGGAVASVTGAVGSIATGGITAASFAAGAIDSAAIATDAIGSAELAASAVTEIQSGLATSAALTTAQTDLDDIQTRLPAALVSGRMDASVGAMATDVLTNGALAASAVSEIQSGLSTLDAAGVRTAVGLASANLDTQLGAVATQTTATAIKAKTDNLPTDPADASDVAAAISGLATAAALSTVSGLVDDLETRLSATRAGYLDNLSGGAVATQASVNTIDDFIDTEVAAIKAKTDLIPAAPAAVSDIPSAATVATQVRTELAVELARIDAAISTRSTFAGTGATLSNAGIDAILDRADGVETGYTVRQVLRLLAAAMAGELSGAATTTIQVRNITDTKVRITATCDADGNRTAVVHDVS